jgi:REP element-mobilizing transposase RayT
MVRSISEVPLFREDSDKDRYLKTLKKYQDVFQFKVYGYCLMSNHAHFIIYANGADISKIMHGLNQSYAQYFNRKYGRHGHLFQDRFKSKIIDSDSYLISLSGYIHNNPMDIEKYNGHVEDYPYSSLGIYMGKRKDIFRIVDVRFILNQFGREVIYARKQYREFIQSCVDMDELPEIEFIDEATEYRSQKQLLVRNFSIDDIIGYITGKVGLKETSLRIKHSRQVTVGRAICVLFMRSFCDLKYKDICRALGNITQSRASKLCSMGIDVIQRGDSRYREMAVEFIEEYGAA